MNLLMIWLALRHAYFAIRCYHIHDPLWVVINSDLMVENEFDNWANIFITALLIQTTLYLNMLYLNNPTTTILDHILINRENKLFYYPYQYRHYFAVDFIGFKMKIWLYSMYLFKINVG